MSGLKGGAAIVGMVELAPRNADARSVGLRRQGVHRVRLVQGLQHVGGIAPIELPGVSRLIATPLAWAESLAEQLESGDPPGLEGVKVDKHSTGGVGDTTTLADPNVVAKLKEQYEEKE